MMGRDVILDVQNLCVEFDTRDGVARVINDLGFSLSRGKTLGILGESGCGKTMTALSIMGLVPSPPGRVAGGEILLNGENLVRADEQRLCEVRGKEISMIFQEPMTSLNPVYSIGNQIVETLRRHEGLPKRGAWDRTVEMLRSVGIHAPRRRVKDFPHEMSGGMRQRVMIAMALACRPKILIADEPTTALDVTVQAQIFDLLRELQEQTQTAIILITHDVGVIAEMAQHVIVMYAGYRVEEGPVDVILQSPKHPYTLGLIACVPSLQADPDPKRPPLNEIPGIVPALTELGTGCPFSPRCDRTRLKCEKEMAPLIEVAEDHVAACWLLVDK
jgi:peptide/nickel transport system ATP-binding protein